MKRNYWNEVSEVNIETLRDVVITLNQNPTTPIHLGNQDFARRFGSILRILDDMIQGKVKVSYIDVSDPLRIIVRYPESDQRSSSSRRASESDQARKER
jgi:hypothetical protein